MNNNYTLKNIVNTYFKKEIIESAEKCVDDVDAIKCAESIKDFFKDATKLKYN